jgi:hypothetical protein
MLSFLDAQMTRTGRSLPYLVEYAWRLARDRVAASTPDELARLVDWGDGKDVGGQRVSLKGLVLQQIEQESIRLERSMSFVIQTAVALARRELEGLPGVGE